MCLAGCSSPRRPRTVGAGPVNCTTTPCAASRNFVIVYGEPGHGGHNAGRMFEIAAHTHEREVRANAFPGVPHFGSSDHLTVAAVSNVPGLISQLGVANVVYFAYFGHSGPTNGGSGPGALFIGSLATSGSNLSIRGEPQDSPSTDIPAPLFRSDGQVRIFGCRGGYGPDPIAQQMKDQLRIPVYAYTNSGGSLFTTDATLGHGGRSVTAADISFSFPTTMNNSTNLWLVPINGTPTFHRF